MTGEIENLIEAQIKWWVKKNIGKVDEWLSAEKKRVEEEKAKASLTRQTTTRPKKQ